MENKNEVYPVGVRDIYRIADRSAEKDFNLREEIEFNPAYEELKQDFSSNPFSARSCRCHPSRC